MEASIQLNFARVSDHEKWQNQAMDDDIIIARLREYLATKKATQSQIAAILWPDGGASQTKVSAIIHGRRRLQTREAAILTRFLGLEKEPDIHMVPIIGLASAGAWQEAVALPARWQPVPSGVAGKRAFGVEIKGDSMNLLLGEGGWAVIDPDQDHLYSGSVYLVENGDHEATVKRYMSDPARLVPVSDNPEHQPIFLTAIHWRVIGRVIAYGSNAGL